MDSDFHYFFARKGNEGNKKIIKAKLHQYIQTAKHDEYAKTVVEKIYILGVLKIKEHGTEKKEKDIEEKESI